MTTYLPPVALGADETYYLPRPKRGVDPEVHRLAYHLRVAATRRPYAAPEARLLDGWARWVALTSREVGPGRLTATGPRWAAVLAGVTAAARLCSEDAQAILAPWLVGGVGAAVPAPGVSPHAAAAAAFVGGGA